MAKPQSMLYQNSQHKRVMNLKYKSKYKSLKRQIKNLVFENSSLCDEVAQKQAELSLAREERRYLIKRLMKHEGLENLGSSERETKQLEKTVSTASKELTQPVIQQVVTEQLPKKRGPKKRIHTDNNEKNNKKNNKPREKVILDSNGKAKFPINLYSILVHSAGEIIPLNSNFHSDRWIYPVGYVVTRIYAHPKDPQRKCVFTCKILNNAGRPQFQIIPDNDLDGVFFGETANVCHQGLLETIQRSLSDVVKLPLHVQGEKFFGLANSTVKSLLNLDPNFEKCANFKGFIEQEDGFFVSEDQDPTMSYEALQTLITISSYHTMPEIKDEPPDELLNIN